MLEQAPLDRIYRVGGSALSLFSLSLVPRPCVASLWLMAYGSLMCQRTETVSVAVSASPTSQFSFTWMGCIARTAKGRDVPMAGDKLLQWGVSKQLWPDPPK